MGRGRHSVRLGLLKSTCIAAGVLIVASAAQAQSSTSDSTAPKAADAPSAHLEEIVVTAERREESLQKAPVAVTAVSGDTLKALNITSGQGLAQVVPNLVIGQNGSSAQVGIRGAISTTPGPFADPAVGFSINGVYIARASAALSSLYDIAQVEVLRGPQGTLYGRNTIAGLINVITAKPKLDKWEGNASLGYGNYNDIEASGMLNVPVSSTIALRGAFDTHRHDGYSNNAPDRDYGDLDATSGRLEALFKPSSRFDALLSLSIYHNGGVGGGGTTGGAPLGLYAQSTGATPYDYQVPNKPTYNDELTRDATLTVNYELPFATATYVGNFRSDDYQGAGPLAVQGPIVTTFPKGLCASVNDPKCFELTVMDNGHQTSHELRLGHNSDVLKWVIGGYYYRYSDHNLTTQTPSPSGAAVDVFKPGRNVESTHALFGQATLSPLHWARVTGGVRYNDEFKSQYTLVENGPVGSVSGLTCNACVPTGAPTQGSFRLHKVTWRAGLDIDLAPNVLLFGSVANGFKNGGINTNGTTFKPEQILNYEAGLKNSLFDHRLQINIDAFHELYTNYQSTAGQLVGSTVSLITLNAGKATINGVELESMALITPSDRLSFNATYLHARFTSFFLPYGDGFNGQKPEDLSGNKVPYTPSVTLRLGYQHTFRLPSGGSIVPRVDTSYVASQELDYHNFPVLHVPHYTRTEATLTYNAPPIDGRIGWNIMAYVKNIENHAVLVTGQVDNTVPLAVMGQAGKDGFYLAPRTYGIRISANF